MNKGVELKQWMSTNSESMKNKIKIKTTFKKNEIKDPHQKRNGQQFSFGMSCIKYGRKERER